MDAAKTAGDTERDRALAIGKCLSSLANSDVSILPPTGDGPDRFWILEANGAGRVRFEPGATVANLPTVIRPPVRRKRKEGAGASGGSKSAGGGKRVSS